MKGIFKKKPGIKPDRIPPTIGLNVGKMDVANCRCIFWDVGGQDRLRSLWSNYYAEAHGMIFVVDSSDPGRFEEARLAFESVQQHEELRDIPVVIIANKQDLPSALSGDAISRKFPSTGPPRIFRVQPTSCLTCEGLEEGVRWVVEESRAVASTFS